MTPRVCDELGEAGFGWIYDERLARCSHALAADGGVWLVDPLAAAELEQRIAALGEPRGVIQLLDRHDRDCAELARRLGVPHHLVPLTGVPGSPFQALPIADSRLWREAALWWPERRALVLGDALGSAPYYGLAAGERLAVHPLLRVRPPRALARLEPEHVLCGHGEGVHGPEAADSVRAAIATARRGLPGAWLRGLRSWR